MLRILVAIMYQCLALLFLLCILDLYQPTTNWQFWQNIRIFAGATVGALIFMVPFLLSIYFDQRFIRERRNMFLNIASELLTLSEESITVILLCLFLRMLFKIFHINSQ